MQSVNRRTAPALIAATLLMALAAAPSLALPDAELARISVHGSSFDDGDLVPIEIEVRSVGADVLPPVPVVLLVNERTYAEWRLPRALAPGESALWDLTWPAVRGGHVLTAVVDPLNDVYESNELNNSAFINLGVGDRPPPFPWGALLAGALGLIGGVVLGLLLRRLRPPAGPASPAR